MIEVVNDGRMPLRDPFVRCFIVHKPAVILLCNFLCLLINKYSYIVMLYYYLGVLCTCQIIPPAGSDSQGFQKVSCLLETAGCFETL